MIQLFTEGGRFVELSAALIYGADMKVTGVEITYGRKFNLGDYNSLELRCSFRGDLDPGESHEDATKRLYTIAKEQVKQEYLLLFNSGGQK